MSGFPGLSTPTSLDKIKQKENILLTQEMHLKTRELVIRGEYPFGLSARFNSRGHNNTLGNNNIQMSAVG